MAVKTREDILTAIKAKLGEQTDDDTIALLEDVTDTFTDLEEKAKGDGTDWKKKYEETDEAWRKKYTERFYSPEPKPNEPKPNQETEEIKNFSDLFKTD